jgi:two-component system LytT family response regulator
LKPITLKRFYAAMQKVDAYFNRLDPITVTPATTSLSTTPLTEEYFFIKSGRTLQKVLLKEILYFEGEKEYVRLVTPTQKLLVYRRLKEIEEQLSATFARVHNSYIVNIVRLDSIRDNHVFIGGKQIPISEKFRDAFMTRIKERVF